MYLHLVYYPGDRYQLENMDREKFAAIISDKTFFLDAVDNDGDALRFQHNNGSHFDVIFLQKEHAQAVYGEILNAVRENRHLTELDIRDRQVSV